MALQCVILAGGLGTRLRPLTETIPKALVPVCGVPFADWQLCHLASQGVRRVVYSVGYRAEMLRDHVGDGARFGLQVEWVDEGKDLRGTGGALRLALDRGALEEAFFVLYGDSYLPVVMAEVEEAWRASQMPALMTVMRNEGRWDSSNATYSGGRVTLYDKRRPRERLRELRWIDYGLSVLTRPAVSDAIEPDGHGDLADLLHHLSVSGRLAGFEVGERFYEVGSEEGLRDLEAHLSREGLHRPGGPAAGEVGR
ncbi:MAG: NTP transferase domain-containing protein [Acidimicrobiaceae bacterium]|nr:NTP transferase domain-containing protein [Acidimicrobiaceae bacterium]